MVNSSPRSCSRVTPFGADATPGAGNTEISKTVQVTDSVRFALVDVFADRPLTGNPLAVVPDADTLDPAQFRAIAREFNQSETTFLVRSALPGVDWRLRSFTPAGAEVDGAGHNALGVWLWLADEGLAGDGPESRHRQEIGPELLDVTVLRVPGEPTRIVLDQGAPAAGATVTDPAPLAAALGLTPEHLDPGRPARVWSTGVAHLMVPVRNRAAVDAAVVQDRPLAAVLAAHGAEGCYLHTVHDTGGTAAYARFFNPTVGIAEDPATGTAAGPLAVALRDAGLARDGEPVLIEQGRALGRPSLIRIDLDAGRVRISGAGLITARGELRLR
jgi:trans-2,3-dihydro-3-hydroxyanthranilate isomerase